MNIRTGNREDLPFLEQMLYEAFFWHPNQVRPELEEFIEHPEFHKLLSEWGRPGDRAVIAEADGTPIGAAWYRLWTEENHSYGFVDASTPELGIAVHPRHRSKSVGRALLRELIEAARKDGFASLSLSVDPSNYARQLYESEAFVKVGESGTSWTMILQL
ncbi:MAG: GNAT family N-acetyltransferase [Deltaproteobacteria bacterium]|nr:GNAT family N-acetyltransferase [Deltaproteobacteria bacterium]